MGLDLTTPLLMLLAVANAALAFRPAAPRTRIAVGLALVALASLLLKDWVEGFIYLLSLP